MMGRHPEGHRRSLNITTTGLGRANTMFEKTMGQKGSNSSAVIGQEAEQSSNDPEARGGISELGNLIKVF